MNLLKAIAFFRDAHSKQVRKYTNAPYFTHCVRVMARAMLLDGITESHLIGFAGHDFIEDVKLPPKFEYDINLSLATLRLAGFDETSINLMLELTNPSKLHPELPRHERTAMNLRHIAGISKIGKQGKMIDRTDNLREMAHADLDFTKLYLGESGQLLEVCQGADEVLATELRRAIDDLDTFYRYRLDLSILCPNRYDDEGR